MSSGLRQDAEPSVAIFLHSDVGFARSGGVALRLEMSLELKVLCNWLASLGFRGVSVSWGIQ